MEVSAGLNHNVDTLLVSTFFIVSAFIHLYPTPRIPDSCSCLCSFITKTATTGIFSRLKFETPVVSDDGQMMIMTILDEVRMSDFRFRKGKIIRF